MRIAIDGPSASGKSTVAKLVAEELGFQYLDTGAMYRTVAAMALERGADPNSECDMEDVMGDILSAGTLPKFAEEIIRSAEVSAIVSAVSSHMVVRRRLTEFQRGIASRGSIVMDGRDIGSVVLPDAELKIYLDASPEIRAKRRAAQSGGDYEEILRAIKERDYKDKTKPIGALIRTPDARYIDSSHMTIDEVVDHIVSLATEIA